MSPKYCRPEDLANEKLVAKTMASSVSELFGLEWNKLKDVYHLDFALTKNGLVAAWAEVKTRRATKQQLVEGIKPMLMNLSKWHAAYRMCDTTAAPFYYIVKSEDGHIGYHRFTTDELQGVRAVKLAGNPARWATDPTDLEPVVVVFPIEMTWIGKE